MSNRARMMMGAAVAIAIVTVSAIRWTAAVEQTPVNGPHETVLSETVSDREQLRRHFLEDWHFQLRR